MNKPQADPIILKGHDGEATAVDWYIYIPTDSIYST